MEALQARLDSFSQATRVKSAATKSSASVSLKWPHPHHFKATPNTLAEAGFYFNPSWDDRDAVTCYMCNKELSDWAENDDPFQIHWTKCKKVCAWAVVRCGLKDDLDDDGNWVFSDATRFPSGKAMEKARRDTFRDWPYDSERNHGASSKKMAHAGFVYTPQSSTDDDTATCLYCNLSLSGWDADDDPLQEHRKREKKSGNACPFFSATSLPVKPRIPPSRASSKAPSRSKTTKVTDDQLQLSASEDELATADVSAGKNKNARGKSKATIAVSSDPLRMSTRRSTRVASGKTATSEVEDEGAGGEVEKSAPKKRKRRGKKKVEAIEEEVEVEVNPEQKEKTTKGARRTKQGTDPPEADAIPVYTKEPSGKKTKGKNKMGHDVDALPSTNPPKTVTRSKSHVRGESNSDVPVSRPVSPRPPASKKMKEPASKVVEPPVGQPSLPDVKRTDMKVVDISTDDDNESPPVVEPPLPQQTTHAPTNLSTFPRAVSPPPIITADNSTLINGTEPELLIPPLATIPMPRVASLTEHDLNMTVEEWIRHEMAVQYELFKGDGERAIELFRQRTAEVRKAIEAL